MDPLLSTVTIAIFLGIAAQVLAHRFKLPAILPLLVFGMAAGPSGLGLFNPATLHHGLEVIIHLGVAIILFEGGLSLDPRQLSQVRGSIRNLLSLGTVITWVGAAWLAHTLLDVSWATASLFGAIVTVTGPTVIQPLLRHMIAPRRVRTILVSEGLMIDAIGAVLAYLVLQWIDRAGLGFGALGWELLTLAATGSVLGFVGGSLTAYAVSNRRLPDELGNLVALTLVLGVFAVAEYQSPQSGVLAVVVMGLTVSVRQVPDLTPLKAFKGQLTVLIISILFVLLSGRLDLDAIYRLGLGGLLVVAGLIFLVRPLAVFASTLGSAELGWRERVLVALTAPRGIVAAAVASLAAIQLRERGAVDDAVALEGLVYLAILLTCTWATVMAPVLPRLLGWVGDPSRRRGVLVGANPLTLAVAGMMRRHGYKAVVIDSSPRRLTVLRKLEVEGVLGDARDAATYEEAGLERDGLLLAMTSNDELNLLVAELVRDEYGIEHPAVVMQQPSTEFGTKRRAWVDLIGGAGLDLPRWCRRLEDGQASLVDVEISGDSDRLMSYRSLLRERPDDIVQVCAWLDGKPRFGPPKEELDKFERLVVLADQSSGELLRGLADHGPTDGDAEDEAPAAGGADGDGVGTETAG